MTILWVHQISNPAGIQAGFVDLALDLNFIPAGFAGVVGKLYHAT